MINHSLLEDTHDPRTKATLGKLEDLEELWVVIGDAGQAPEADVCGQGMLKLLALVFVLAFAALRVSLPVGA